MTDYYDELRRDPAAVLYQLNPSLFVGDVNNCPATADAVDNYLASGDLTRADASGSRFRIDSDLHTAALPTIMENLAALGHGHHYVIRGTRGHESRFAPNHYFVLANIHNRVVLIDAYTHELLDSSPTIQEYLRRGQFRRFAFATRFEASPPPGRPNRR